MSGVSASRINALFDGLVAIAITVMVLNLELPADSSQESLWAFGKSIGVFFITFVVVAFQWNQHQRLMDGVERMSNGAVWRTLILLFFIALMPFFTKWIVQNPGDAAPAIGYDIVFICTQLAFRSVASAVLRETGGGAWRRLPGDEKKKAKEALARFDGSAGRFALRIAAYALLLAAGIGLSLVVPAVSLVLFVLLPAGASLLNVFRTGPKHLGKRRSGGKRA